MGYQRGQHEGETLLHGGHRRIGDRHAPQLFPDVALEIGGRKREHAAHRHGEDKLDDGGLEPEEYLVAEDEGEAAGDGEENRVGGDEGIGLPVLYEHEGELEDSNGDADHQADRLTEEGVRPDEEQQGKKPGNK